MRSDVIWMGHKKSGHFRKPCGNLRHREIRVNKYRRRASTDAIESGDDVAADSKTVDEVAGDDEGPANETGQPARCVAERPQPVDLLGHAAAARRRRRARRPGLAAHQQDGEMREETIQRVGETEIRALLYTSQYNTKSS